MLAKKISLLLDSFVWILAAFTIADLMDLMRNWIPVIVAVAVFIIRFLEGRSNILRNKRESTLTEERIKEQVLKNLQRELEIRQIEKQNGKPHSDEEKMVN